MTKRTMITTERYRSRSQDPKLISHIGKVKRIMDMTRHDTTTRQYATNHMSGSRNRGTRTKKPEPVALKISDIQDSVNWVLLLLPGLGRLFVFLPPVLTQVKHVVLSRSGNDTSPPSLTLLIFASF